MPSVSITFPDTVDPQLKKQVNADLGVIARFPGPERDTAVVLASAVVVINTLVQPFWQGMAEKWGHDFAAATHRFFSRLRHAGPDQPWDIVFRDSEHPNVDITFDDGSVADAGKAFAALRELDLSVYQDDVTLTWHAESGTWKARPHTPQP